MRKKQTIILQCAEKALTVRNNMSRLPAALRQVVRLFKDVPRTCEEAAHYERAFEKAREEWEHRHEPTAVSFATNAPAPHRPTVRCPDGSVVYCDTGEEAPDDVPCDSEPGVGGRS